MKWTYKLTHFEVKKRIECKSKDTTADHKWFEKLEGEVGGMAKFFKPRFQNHIEPMCGHQTYLADRFFKK